MLAELSSDQISEWMAWDMVHVPPELESAALVASTVANVMGGGKRTWRPKDFIPTRPKPAEEMESKQMFVNIGVAPQRMNHGQDR